MKWILFLSTQFNSVSEATNWYSSRCRVSLRTALANQANKVLSWPTNKNSLLGQTLCLIITANKGPSFISVGVEVTGCHISGDLKLHSSTWPVPTRVRAKWSLWSLWGQIYHHRELDSNSQLRRSRAVLAGLSSLYGFEIPLWVFRILNIKNIKRYMSQSKTIWIQLIQTVQCSSFSGNICYVMLRYPLDFPYSLACCGRWCDLFLD